MNINNSSIIANNDNFVTEKIIETALIHNYPTEKIIPTSTPTTIIIKKEESQMNQTKNEEDKNKNKNNNKTPEKSIIYKDKNELIETKEAKSILGGIFRLLK